MKKAFQDDHTQHSKTWEAKTPSWATVPSRFSREERKVWQEWNDNPNGAKPHQDMGSRSRPMSIVTGTASVDELWDAMVKRGIVAGPKRSTAVARGRGKK
jgi:hypothetical protein